MQKGRKLSGRRITLPKGTKIEDGRVINPEPRPRDVSQRIAWQKSKKSRPVTKARAALNSIGKAR